jgi:hypothetical protein
MLQADARIVPMPAPPTPHSENLESSQQGEILEEPIASSAEGEVPQPETPELAPAILAEASEEKAATPAASVASKRTGKLLTWGRQLGANQKALRQTAILTAFCAAAAIWVMVLGATGHRITPIAPVPAAVAETSAVPVAKPAAPQVMPADPAPVVKKSPAPAKLAPRPRAKSRAVGHNPEEDMVAKDFVIRYNRRPVQPRTQAKKTAPRVKYYSDLH